MEFTLLCPPTFLIQTIVHETKNLLHGFKWNSAQPPLITIITLHRGYRP